MMDLVLVPSTALVLGCYGCVLAKPSAKQEWRWLWVVLIVYFLLSWILWWIGNAYAFSGAAFPAGFMITGGILGHLTAMVNPLLYGVFWRRWYLQQQQAQNQNGSSKETSPLEAVVA